jgi:xylan 1,4-beta-xylosidase
MLLRVWCNHQQRFAKVKLKQDLRLNITVITQTKSWTFGIVIACGAAIACVSPALSKPPSAPASNKARTISIDVRGATKPRDPMATMSIGSDFPGTLARSDSLAQLRTLQSEIGFRYIRFHNVFADQFGIYREVSSRPVYDWSKIDQLYDQLLAMKLKPFVELGFTPDAMKTSNQTLFYWKGNTSHPDPAKWTALVDAFARHMVDRYGIKEVRSWYFEFWNEPNLKDFWEGADQKAYFEYYGRTARALKAIDPGLRVGGPATAGAAWVPEFLAYAKANTLPVDFISTHTYGVDGGFLDENGAGDTKLLRDPDAIVADVRRVREQIQASSQPDLPLFFTEWSSSYSPRDPVHDDYLGAAYILSKLRRTEGLAQGMSYWTYSDLFEEPGPQTKPFEGGFGLMSPQGIRKPAWFAFKYLGALGDRELPTDDDQSIGTLKGRTVQVLAWNSVIPDQPISNRPFFTKPRPATAKSLTNVRLSGLTPGHHSVRIRTTGYQRNDAYTAYLEMGRPSTLTTIDVSRLQALTADTPEMSELQVKADGKAVLRVPMRENDAVLIEVDPGN